jgi:hypothetical protein
MDTIFNVIRQSTGIFSKDLKVRFGNKQIKLNGETVDKDHELNVARDEAGNFITEELGDFIFHNIIPNEVWTKRVELFGLENLFNSNIQNDLTEFLKQFAVIKTGRNKLTVIKLK